MIFEKDYVIKIKCIILFFFLGLTYIKAQNVVDSLEVYAKKAKPGWDQIDIAIGLGRLYTNAAFYNKAQEQIDNIYKWSKESNIPSARAYGLTLEGCVADAFKDNANKAIVFFKEAMKVAITTKNKDAYTYAATELSKILIWNKGDTEKGLDTLYKLLDDLDETVSKKNEGTIYFCLGHAYMVLGTYEKSFKYLNKALICYEEIIKNPMVDPKINRVSAQLAKPMKHIGFVLNDLGSIYLDQGKVVEAISYKKQALAAIKKTNTITYVAWMHVNLSRVYSSLGDYNTALVYIGEARKMYESRKLYADIAWVDANMTNLFFNLKDYKMAEKYSEKNLNYLEKFNPKSRYYGQTLLKMVEIQFCKEDLALAAFYLKKATSKISKVDKGGNKAKLLRLKGEMAIGKREFEEAKVFLKQALALYKTGSFEYEIAICEYHLATVFYNQEMLNMSISYANNALEKAALLKKVDLAKDCYALLSKVYNTKGDYKNAFKNHQAFFVYSDSLYTNEALNKLKTEQVRQDVVSFKKEKELAEQNAKLLKERNKLYVIWGGAILIGLLMMGYLYVSLVKVKAKIQSQNTQLIQLNETKDKFFGIIAHDLRSPLLGLQSIGNQISYFIRKEQPKKLIELSGHIEDSTKKVTELLDNLLSWALLQNGMIPYNPEEVNLKLLTDDVVALLNPIANRKQIILTNNVKEDSFVYADSKAVHTIVRNLISNALKYTDVKGKVYINIQNKNEQSIITINDTGTGIATNQISKLFKLGKKSVNGTLGEEGSGLGLILCKELIELNKGTIKVISELGKGSSFIFNLPKATKIS